MVPRHHPAKRGAEKERLTEADLGFHRSEYERLRNKLQQAQEAVDIGDLQERARSPAAQVAYIHPVVLGRRDATAVVVESAQVVHVIFAGRSIDGDVIQAAVGDAGTRGRVVRRRLQPYRLVTAAGILGARRYCLPSATNRADAAFCFGHFKGSHDQIEQYGTSWGIARGILPTSTDSGTGRPRLTGAYDQDDSW